jgi:exodeoxyribonuclease-3
MRIYSWNVNGVRAAMRNGLGAWLSEARPDILCLQETRLDAAAVPDDLRTVDGYSTYWSPLRRPGYGGVATFSRQEPLAWRVGMGIPDFDDENRVLITEHPGFSLYNVYFPNGKSSPERLAYKLAFYDAFQHHVDARVKDGHCLIVVGDVNTAHREIDIARPQAHQHDSGFLPEERAWLDRFLAGGWVDTFRHFHPDETGAYTWWNPRSRARARNVGWRIDYGFVPERCLSHVLDAGISPEVPGSDHCPIWLDVAFTP